MSALLVADVTLAAEILSQLFAVLTAVGSLQAMVNNATANVRIAFDILTPRT
jgi:hypothetical protein